MPCNGGNYFGGTRVVSDPADQKRIDELTRRLCHACTLLQEAKITLPDELDEWWYEHRLADEERKLEAKRRAEAEEAEVRRKRYLKSVKSRLLKQLSDDEKEALGLKK